MGQLSDWWPVIALPLGWLFLLIQEVKSDLKELRKEKNSDLSDVREDVGKVAETMTEASSSIHKRLDSLMLQLMERKR